MNRRIEILEESTVIRKITRIHETDNEEPPAECIECGAPTLYDAEGITRECIDCGEIYEAIEIQLPLALAAGQCPPKLPVSVGGRRA